jgi:hypothetical protein
LELPEEKGPTLEKASATEAGERVRTVDIHVGNVTLYQLSYARTTLKVLNPRRTSSFYPLRLSLHPALFRRLAWARCLKVPTRNKLHPRWGTVRKRTG